jgi:serine protease 16
MDSFCQAEFGISQTEISTAIDKTNKFYGGNKPNSTCILYPNGEVDPWHSLSVLTPVPGIDTLWVEGASHHAWTHPSAPGDQASVVAARKKIRTYVTTYLSKSCATSE